MDRSDSIQDDLLVLQCQQGDAGCFDRLVRRWQQPLLNYAYRVTGDWAVAQDIVQETWLAVIRGLITLKDVAYFRTWLYRIASHKCQDHWRRKQTRQGFAEELQKQPLATGAPPNAERADIDASFRRLPPDSRTVLALMYLEDFSIGEIAGLLSLPEGTVKSRLFHARQQLRQLLEKDYGPV
ncbi:MAG: RNA polymerase sigma factor [Verrucomicrobiota bacterium]|jgi:RNA polymerase sigma-70 factor (ECF subfamily)